MLGGVMFNELYALYDLTFNQNGALLAYIDARAGVTTASVLNRTYVGAKNIKALPKCTTFIRVTQTTNEIFSKTELQ